MDELLAVILGGGAGKRLFPLTMRRSKPAVPLGGKYRLIDIPVSNCINSDIHRIFVLTQYNSASLNRHIARTYQFDRFREGFVTVLAAEQTPELAGSPSRLEIPIDPGSAVAMRERLNEGSVTLKERIDFMVGINRDLASNHAEDYARMFERLLELEDGAFLVHCSAGKDRTGFACALILHALGVSEATVLEDYLLTNEAMDYEGYVLKRIRSRLWADLEADRESTMALFGVRPEYLRSAYDAIAAEFEGVEHYIEQAIGLDRAARERLQSRYLIGAEG